MSWPFTAIPKPRSWPIWASTRCSIAARRAPASPPATASEIHYQEIDGARGRYFHRTSVLSELPGTLAIGHTRYSTAGDTVLIECAAVLGALQQGPRSRSPTTAISPTPRNCARISKRAAPSSRHRATPKSSCTWSRTPRERTLAGALRDALLQLEGAFSLVFLAQDRIIVARDPHGFRPLAMGQLEFSGGTSATFSLPKPARSI